MPRVLERARELFGTFTNYAYELEVARADGTSFHAIETSSGERRWLNELSDGTRVQLALAARLAFGELADEALLASIPFHPETPPSRVMIDLAPENSKRRMVWMLDTGAANSVATPLMARSMGAISFSSLNVVKIFSSRHKNGTGADDSGIPLAKMIAFG